MGIIAGSKPKLKKVYEKKGYVAKRLKYAGDVFLYERSHSGGKPHWEVVIAKKNYSSLVSEPFVYPSDADWGSKGWTFTNKEKANNKFNKLTNK